MQKLKKRKIALYCPQLFWTWWPLRGEFIKYFNFWKILKYKNTSKKRDIARKTLHNIWGFPLRISPVNVTKSAVFWSHLLEKSLMENFIFCAVFGKCRKHRISSSLLKKSLMEHFLFCAVSKGLIFINNNLYTKQKYKDSYYILNKYHID